MVKRFLVLGAVLALAAPLGAQAPVSPSPVHATLRVAGGRTTFKSGEPIRLELVLTADAPGFVVDTSGLDEASDTLTISPEAGVVRFPRYGWRDVLTPQPLSSTPTVLPLTLNYWVRFDRADDYTIAIKTRRVQAVGKNGWSGDGPPVLVQSPPVTVHVDLIADAEEQELLRGAVSQLQSAIGHGFDAEIRAAEALAFLPGDAAAIEKFRQYRALAGTNAVNARSLLHRGFLMSRHPSIILQELDAELTDPTRPISSSQIYDAVNLRVSMEFPGEVHGGLFAPEPDGTDPTSRTKTRYLDEIHDSLALRSGDVLLKTAAALVDVAGRDVWPDVKELVVTRFDDYPAETRAWLVTSEWGALRDTRLAPSLIRLLSERDAYSRRELLAPLAEIAPDAARDAIRAELKDPRSLLGPEDVANFPPATFGGEAAAVLSDVRRRAGTHDRLTSRKAQLLAAIAGPESLDEVLALYQQCHGAFDAHARGSLLAYLTRTDPKGTAALVSLSLRAEPSVSLLYYVTQNAYSPAIDTVVKERLWGDDFGVAANAAGILLSRGTEGDRELVEARLVRWQSAHRGAAPPEQQDADAEAHMTQVLVGGTRLPI